MSKRKNINKSKQHVTALDFLRVQEEQSKLNQWYNARSDIERTLRLITATEKHTGTDVNSFSPIYTLGSFLLDTTIKPTHISDFEDFTLKFKSYFASPIVELRSNVNVTTVPYAIFPTSKPNSLIPSTAHKSEVAKLTENIRLLKIRLKQNRSRVLLFEIKELVLQLQFFICDNIKKQRKYVKKIRARFRVFLVRNIRDLFRNLIRSIFKNLSDLSGCKEDINLDNAQNYRFILFNLHLLNHDQYKKYYWRNRRFHNVCRPQINGLRTSTTS